MLEVINSVVVKISSLKSREDVPINFSTRRSSSVDHKMLFLAFAVVYSRYTDVNLWRTSNLFPSILGEIAGLTFATGAPPPPTNVNKIPQN